MIDVINVKFNEKLLGLTPANADRVIFSLGRPSEVLLSVGIEDKEIKLYGNKIFKKVKKHGYQVSDLKDLPQILSNPIIVFDDKQHGGHLALTVLQLGGNNAFVSLEVGDGSDMDFNIVKSVFGKSLSGIIWRINSGHLLYADKEKALSYLSTPAPIAGAKDNREPAHSCHLRTSALVADAIGTQEFKNTDPVSTLAPIAGAADDRELLEAINIVNGFENPLIYKDNTFPDEMSIPKNNFSPNGDKNAQS